MRRRGPRSSVPTTDAAFGQGRHIGRMVPFTGTRICQANHLCFGVVVVPCGRDGNDGERDVGGGGWNDVLPQDWM